MIDLILAPDSRPFTVALVIMSGLAALEMAFVLGGLGGLSQLIDALLPDSFGESIDLDLDAEIEADLDLSEAGELPHVGNSSALQSVLSFFGIGTVPFLVVLVAFLTGFGLAGLAIQFLFSSVAGLYLPASLASIPAVIAGSTISRRIALFFGKLIPSVETDAVSSKSFIGRVAKITLGTAKQGAPAQARLRGPKGHRHVVLVEPDQDDQILAEGTRVLLVSQNGSIFRAIPVPSESLFEK
jgi:hypothetical protein